MRLARCIDGIVVEIATQPDAITELVSPAVPAREEVDGSITEGRPAAYADRASRPSDFYHPDLVFEPVGDDVDIGWIRTDSGYQVPPPPETAEG